jgi:sugar phosphate isomerase/epimerase
MYSMTEPDRRLGCSTISFRHQNLGTALNTIQTLGFSEIDLGALPGVCDHVPFVLDDAAVAEVARTVVASGLAVRSINADIGDLNVPLDDASREARRAHLDSLVALAVATDARALVLPCGAIDHTPVESLEADVARVATELAWAAGAAAARGVELWTETLHLHRLCHDLDRAHMLADRLTGDVGIVMDFSHVVASGGDPVDFIDRFGPRIRHVHVRDATPGNINVSVGSGHVDFARGIKQLASAGYRGHFSLELETRDVTDDQRPAATANAARLISALI